MSHWWEDYPWRMVQTNLREIDMENMDAKAYAKELADFGATVVTLNAAGIIASYDTGLACQPRSGFLTGDSLRDMIEACHAEGIRVIARTDFSKVRYPVYEAHPDWAYRDKDGQILNYNGDVQTCPSGEYQKEKTLEILRELLTSHPFDGVFCNMSGFLVVDYSGVYHGPCHCENCRRLFREKYGLEIPEKDDPKDPAYARYSAFKNEVIKENRRRLIETVRSISPEIAINGTDYIRTESATEIGVPQWQFSASSNARLTAGPDRTRPADNASVDFLGFRYRDTSVSPAQMALRQWQNLASAGSVSLYIMGTLSNHRDRSGLAPSRRAFTFFKEHEEYFAGLTSAARVLLLHKNLMARIDQEAAGWVRALTALHIPFDEVKQAEFDRESLKGKELLILPDAGTLKKEQCEIIDEFASGGGMVVATGTTGMRQDLTALKCLGIEEVEGTDAGLMSSVLMVSEKEGERFPASLNAPYIAFGSEFVRVRTKAEAQGYLQFIPEHPFGPPERCYFTEVTERPGVTVYPFGKGKGIYLPWKAGTFYYAEGYQNTLNVISDVLHSICGLPDLAPGLTPMAELVLCRKAGTIVVQLVNASGVFANSYFDPLPIRDIRLLLPEVKGTARALNGGMATSKNTEQGLEITLNVLHEYEMLIIE